MKTLRTLVAAALCGFALTAAQAQVGPTPAEAARYQEIGRAHV